GDAEYLITVKGRAAHSGRGWTGVNAIEYGASLIEELKKLGVKISKRRSRINAEPIWGTKKMRPGLYVNTAKGGLKGNIIPDTFEILVDRRFIPEVTALGVPVAVLGTTRRDSNIHGIDEHVRIGDLVSVTKILAHTFLELL